MARHKVAKTLYEIQAYTRGEDYKKEGWLTLGEHLTNADPANTEDSDTQGFLDGDGTPETDVTARISGYTFTGFRNDENDAQNLIADMEFAVGDGTKVWFKRTLPSGIQHTGVATVTAPTLGGGEATEFDQFAATITWDKQPEKTEDGQTEE